MSLACSSLSIGQNRCIIALKDGADGRHGSRFIDVLLRRVHIVDLVETVSVPHGQVRVQLNVLGPGLVIKLAPKVLHYGDRSAFRHHIHNWKEEVSLLLTGQRWSQPDHHFKVLVNV